MDVHNDIVSLHTHFTRPLQPVSIFDRDRSTSRRLTQVMVFWTQLLLARLRALSGKFPCRTCSVGMPRKLPMFGSDAVDTVPHLDYLSQVHLLNRDAFAQQMWPLVDDVLGRYNTLFMDISLMDCPINIVVDFGYGVSPVAVKAETMVVFEFYKRFVSTMYRLCTTHEAPTDNRHEVIAFVPVTASVNLAGCVPRMMQLVEALLQGWRVFPVLRHGVTEHKSVCYLILSLRK